MQLHARAGRAVLVGHDGTAEREVDPRSLALPADLGDALHEWAQVALALVPEDNQPVGGVAGDLVTRRGRQLAGRLATELGMPVSYTDPVSGEVLEVAPAPSPLPDPVEELPEQQAEPAEPTPWGTGLTVTAVTAAVVVVAVTALSSSLAQASPWLAVVANLVVVGGLSPSVWLARAVPTWRWVALGVACGLPIAWVLLLLSLLGPHS
ncbi:DUF2537 domain-containing protein [Kutzneria viridogrisea]|uniref:DUF2537 domain-containing protein n=2 Tax=Kutzneria TaxID=43356 RepID=A0ABR6BWN9_9PSEU|nr:DUF2537 domain-containing protein [Kutzneria albida]AHH93969.1 putative membrane protein [Kutzneria albida DSM 43870]MBA8931026.1 hypothetical protein [Kutzneria viridogrisea]